MHVNKGNYKFYTHMASREETLRQVEGSDVVLRDLVKDITGKEITAPQASDLNKLLFVGRDTDNNPPKTFHKKQYHSQRVWAKKRRAREKAETKLKREGEALAALMIKLKAGDPEHPDYEQRLNLAKRTTRLKEELPKNAQKKWGNPAFRQKMEERGMFYNVAEWKGWLPYDEAKRLQQTLIGAKSRGEYEVYMKLWTIRWLPARPDRVYGEHWKGWTDFLGTVNVFGKIRKNVDVTEYRSFYEALTLARSLKLKNVNEWREACKNGRVPLDVPIDPHNVYPNDFVSIEHWLGTEKAVDVVKGKAVIVDDVWVLYTDGREDACWWAKMSLTKYKEFKELDGITSHRVYEFEGDLANDVWVIFDELSSVYETDQRERLIASGDLVKITTRLDAILKWKVNF